MRAEEARKTLKQRKYSFHGRVHKVIAAKDALLAQELDQCRRDADDDKRKGHETMRPTKTVEINHKLLD